MKRGSALVMRLLWRTQIDHRAHAEMLAQQTQTVARNGVCHTGAVEQTVTNIAGAGWITANVTEVYGALDQRIEAAGPCRVHGLTSWVSAPSRGQRPCPADGSDVNTGRALVNGT